MAVAIKRTDKVAGAWNCPPVAAAADFQTIRCQGEAQWRQLGAMARDDEGQAWSAGSRIQG